MKSAFRILGGALLAVVLAGCHAPTSSEGTAPNFQLKLYRVPVEQSKAVSESLKKVLESSGYLVGMKTQTEMSVTQPFPGAILVLAPAALQPSIGSAIGELSKVPVAKSPPKIQAAAPKSAQLRVRFWMVQAKSGAGGDTESLHPLEPALKQVRSSLGPSHFVQEDVASALVDAPDQPDESLGNGLLVTSRGHSFRFHAMTTADAGVKLRVDYSDMTAAAASQTFPQLKTTITLRQGEYAILAEAPPSTKPANTPDATLMNLLVVRVDRVAPTSH
jgi:hypothetical protein